MIHWFFDSLHLECAGNYEGIKLVVIDFHESEPGRREFISNAAHCEVTHVEPKPSLWRGRHRLTKVDYHGVASARNTAVCLAPDGWIVCVDDLTVIIPGWMKAVRRAMSAGYVCCGAYRKVKQLVVENGQVASFENNPTGNDHRIPSGSDTEAVPCHPQWLYGCSNAIPVEAMLKINGWPEMCDSTGIGMEDCHTGIALVNQGYTLRYDRSMMTFESEEHHHGENLSGIRMDKNRGKLMILQGGISAPDEKSWALVRLLKEAKRFDNYFGQEGITGLRQRTLAGEPFPIPTEPTTDFYDGQPLTEL